MSPDHNLYDYNAPTYPRRLISSNTIQNRWIFPLPSGEEVQIDMFFTPDNYVVMLVDSADTSYDTLGVIKVEYDIHNNGMLLHSVGVEHKWDIKIDSSDGSPVSIPGSYADTNCVYEGSVPGTFIAAEFDLFDPTLDQLVATGLLGTDDATIPDFFAYGDEMVLIPSVFSVTTAFTGGTYSYSAALLRWNERMLPPGGSLSLITYYGLGKISAIHGELALTVHGSNWTTDSCRLIGNPKEFSVDAKNSSIGLTILDTLWVCVDYDSGLAAMVIDPFDIYEDSLCVEYYAVAPGATNSPVWLFNADPDTFGLFCITYSCSTSTPGIASVETTFCYNIPYIDCLALSLSPGWNLVSYPDSFGGATSFFGASDAYAWNNPAADYAIVTDMEAGIGYWVLNTSPYTVMLAKHLPDFTDSVFIGWNLIGAADHAVSTSDIVIIPPGLGLSPPYGWNGTDYFYADSLYPGHGYWFLSSGNGRIIVGP